MPADHYVMDSDMKKVADAIRTKGGTTEPLVFPDGFVQAILAIGPPKVEPRTWTRDDFIESGRPPFQFKYNIKPEIRQYFTVGDKMDLSVPPGLGDWASTPIPGLSITNTKLTGTITGGTGLTDVMDISDSNVGESMPFRTANGDYIPIKNP